MATSPPTPADNPLLALGELSDAIRFDAIRPEHIAPAIDALLARAQVAVDAIGSAAGTPTYETTLQALEDATFALERSAQLCEHLESVATSDALRATWNETQPRIAAFWSSLPLNEGLYKVLRAFADTAEAKSLEPVRRRHLDKTLEDFRRHGAELDAEGKARLEAIDASSRRSRRSSHRTCSTRRTPSSSTWRTRRAWRASPSPRARRPSRARR
jgi:oligopeptidase A